MNKIIKYICITFTCIIVFGAIVATFSRQTTSIVSEENNEKDIKISHADNVNLDEIISENLKDKNMNLREEIYITEEELEYITKYRKNDELYKGTTQVSQEGRKGIQTITTKRTYDENNNVIEEKQMSAVITKAALNKIIDIGTKEKVEISGSAEGLNENIKLNKVSGFTLEQFKKALTDKRDQNKVFENNAQYFYYIEKEYNINGMFVAAVGIHESNWGKSNISKKKYNLFGYGAYDSNPYNGAYTFENYSESIDLIARVFVKYYINKPGTKIYDNEIANGKYYSGETIASVGKKYASDKNWANAVYKQMQYLYNKLKY